MNPALELGLREVLQRLSKEEALAVAKTVTEVQYKTREAAITALVQHTDNPRYILSKRRVRRQVLYDYATAKSIPVKVKATKDDIMEALIEHWSQNAMAMEQQHHQHHQHHQSPPHQPHHHQPQQQPGTALAVPSQDTEVVAYEQDPNNLALMFCEVFFGMFDPPSFTTDLFFDDCELNLHVAPAGQIEQHQGSASVVHRLTKLPQQDNVLFRPGDGGIRGMLEPHGLLAVEVHGTVHSPGAVIGHFRQACLLAQDPFLQDTWRVRNINIECQLFPSLNG